MTRLAIAQIGLILVVFHGLLLAAAGMVWVERRLAAVLQQRLGPNRVGWAGLLQPFADVIKLMFKEELRPKAADAFLFGLAPIISAMCAFAAFAVVPFGGTTTLLGLIPEGFPLLPIHHKEPLSRVCRNEEESGAPGTQLDVAVCEKADQRCIQRDSGKRHWAKVSSKIAN